MRIFDILNPYKLLCETEMLEETLSTDFKIGFELEGVCTKDRTYNDYLPGYHSGREPEGIYKELLDQIDGELGLGKGKIESDGSLEPDERGGRTFEYGSPIIPFNPTNISKIYNLLKKLPEFDVYTNDTCGFHTHISFEGINKVNAAWIMCCIAIDDKALEEVNSLKAKDRVIPFLSRYAKMELFDKLREAIINNDYNRINRLLDTNEKYYVVRVHPAGTLEWRGPRNFMNNNEIELIHEYIKKVYKVIMMFSKMIRADSWEGVENTKINKKDFEKFVHVTNDFETPEEKRTEKRNKGFMDRVRNEPDLLLRLSKKGFEKALENSSIVAFLSNRWGAGLRISRELPTDKFEMLVSELFRQYDSEMGSALYDYLIENLQNPETKQDRYDNLPKDVKKLFVNNIIRDRLSGRYVNEEILGLINFKDPQMSEKINKFVMSKKPNEMAEFFMRMVKDGFDIDIKLYQKILNSKYFYVLANVKNLPVKIQRMMVRKSPYMVQYIQNIDPQLLASLKAKHPDIENHVIGV